MVSMVVLLLQCCYWAKYDLLGNNTCRMLKQSQIPKIGWGALVNDGLRSQFQDTFYYYLEPSKMHGGEVFQGKAIPNSEVGTKVRSHNCQYWW